MAYPFLVLYPVNPATAARYRQAFKTSRAKSDPSDAQVCLELLLQHRDKLTPWLARGSADPRARRVSWNSAAPRSICAPFSTNMLRDALKSYYPQALDTGRPGSLCPARLPVPPQVALAPGTAKGEKRNVRKFYYAHNCRRLDLINQRLDAIAAMIPLTSDQAVIEPAKVQVRMLARQLLQLAAALKEYDTRIAQLFALPCRCLHLAKLPRRRAHPRAAALLRLRQRTLPLPERRRHPAV